MTASINCPSAVIIESSGNVKNVVDILKESFIKNIAVIDIRCLDDRFTQIQELMNNNTRLKVFHSGNTETFSKMVKSFDIDLAKRRDIVHIQCLNRKEIVRSYWGYYFEKFPSTVSRSFRGDLIKEEI